MSTIIIIGGGTKPNANRVVETAEGAEIQDSDGTSVAVFKGEDAYDKAIKYLKVMKG